MYFRREELDTRRDCGKNLAFEERETAVSIAVQDGGNVGPVRSELPTWNGGVTETEGPRPSQRVRGALLTMNLRLFGR